MTITNRPDGSVIVTRDDGGETWVPAFAYRAIYALGYEDARKQLVPEPEPLAPETEPESEPEPARKGARA